MNPEGEIVARLTCEGARVTHVEIASARPGAARALLGMTAGEAARTVPLLFSICARSQALAAQQALGAAAGDPTHSRDAREAALVETICEHLRTLLVEWPRVLNGHDEPRGLAATRLALAAMAQSRGDDAIATLADVAQAHVYARPLADWLRLSSVEALCGWTRDSGTIPAKVIATLLADDPALGAGKVALMPALTDSGISSALREAIDASEGFERSPAFAGTPVETGALARNRDVPVVAAVCDRYGHGVVARVTARLADLACLLRDAAEMARQLSSSWTSAQAVADGIGIAAVETARGVLLHRARVSDGRVRDYRIVAPTQWNFHPDGAFAQGLLGRPVAGGEALRRQAAIVLAVIDPCVPARIEVLHA